MVEIALAAWGPVFASYQNIMGENLFTRVHSNWKIDKEAQIRTAASPNEPMLFLVAEIDNCIAGFVSWHHQVASGIAEIGNNAVGPKWQNNGIATALYRAVIDRCREAGIATIKVSTGLDSSHAPARRAYEKAGFSAPIPMVTYWQDIP